MYRSTYIVVFKWMVVEYTKLASMIDPGLTSALFSDHSCLQHVASHGLISPFFMQKKIHFLLYCLPQLLVFSLVLVSTEAACKTSDAKWKVIMVANIHGGWPVAKTKPISFGAPLFY